MLRKNKIRVIICILFAILFLSSCSKEYSSSKEEDYSKYVSEVLDAEDFMPSLDELGNYESILVTRKTPNDIFFSTTDAVALVVQYSEEEYTKEVSRVLTEYKFLTEGCKYVTDIEANVKGFVFRVTDETNDYFISSTTGEGIITAKMILTIGMDDTNFKIAYLYHWDHSLDYIKNLDKFISKYYVLK